MSDNEAPRSPSLLTKPPKHGLGVRRLNSRPVLFATGGAIIVVAAVGYAYRDRIIHSLSNADRAGLHTPQPGSGASVLSGAPSDGIIQAVMRPAIQPKPDVKALTPVQQGSAPTDKGNSEQGEDEATKARREAWRVYYQQLAQLQQARLSAATTALSSENALSANGGGAAPATTGVDQQIGQTRLEQAQNAQLTRGVGFPGLGAGFAPGFGGSAAAPTGIDTSAQREKQAFLNQPGDLTGLSYDLPTRVQDASSPFLVMQGTAIAATMDGGLNSDIPGQIRAHVNDPIYDTATGRFLLIPAGATLIGTYDNMVSHGQERLAVVWHRIIFPDTSSISIGNMAGADEAGYAGFHDRVNTHFWSKVGNAMLISIAGAASQLAQGGGQSVSGYNSQQIAAASIGQQFAELGQEYARAGLSIPNTLEIRPGYRFDVIVNRDMHLRPYVDRRTVTGVTPISLGPVVQ